MQISKIAIFGVMVILTGCGRQDDAKPVVDAVPASEPVFQQPPPDAARRADRVPTEDARPTVAAPSRVQAVPDSPTPARSAGTDEITTATTCITSLGEKASSKLAARCRAVSPATRPPCNAVNPCEVIQAEIDRSCTQFYAEGEKPLECTVDP